MRLPFLALLLAPGPAAAHEFWIAPEAYQVAPGEAIVADLRNGEFFSGRALSYLPSRFERFEIVQDGVAVPVEGTVGDRPALSQPAPGEGLAVVVHETGDRSVAYDEMEEFAAFAEHKGFPWVVEAHRERGLGLPVRERYRRHAKSLVAVGEGGADAAVGLRAEFVALGDPHDGGEALPVELRFDGAPAGGAQVEVFVRRAEGVEVSTLETDGAGRVTVPLEGGTEVMLDAVFVEALDPEEGAHWMTHWANLTFAVP